MNGSDYLEHDADTALERIREMIGENVRLYNSAYHQGFADGYAKAMEEMSAILKGKS